MKARSRLKAENGELPVTTAPVTSTHTRKPLATHATLKSFNFSRSGHVTHLGTLGLGLFFLISLYFFMNSVSPTKVANWLLPNSYLMFQFLLFASLFFLASFLWLHTRRGYLTALAIQTFVFLKLQKIEVTWQMALGILTLFVIIELLFTYLEKRFYTHANLHQSSHSRHRRTRS